MHRIKKVDFVKRHLSFLCGKRTLELLAQSSQHSGPVFLISFVERNLLRAPSENSIRRYDEKIERKVTFAN